MNTQSNAISEFGGQTAPAILSATRPFYWSVRRELWEYRSIYLAPLAIAVAVLLGFVVVLIRLPQTFRYAMTLDPMQQRDALSQPFEVAAGLVMAGAFIVSVYYALDTLYGERRDRSILFWKSLPVSDLTAVLAKASVLLLVLPVVAFVITVAADAILVVLSCAVLAANGLSVATFWTQLMPFESMGALLYHLVTVHILWYAPLYTWMMLISAASRRAPLLWAALPPFAIVVFERIAFHHSWLQDLLESRVTGSTEAVEHSNMLDPGMRFTPGHFVATPGLWLGLLFAAAFLFAAARFRRYRGPI